jgi:hypothetical protein
LKALASPDVCPVLQDIDLFIGYDIILSDAALLPFIAARMLAPGGPSLKRVVISFGRRMQVDIMANLQPFIAMDLHVSLNYYIPSEPRYPQSNPPPLWRFLP